MTTSSPPESRVPLSENRLSVRGGFASLQGRRDENQDFAGFAEPAGRDLWLRGIVAAVADGLGGLSGGRTAAEVCVRLFLEAWYSLPETLDVEPLAGRCLASANQWIHAIGRQDPALAHMATTFSALILKGRCAHLVHVGDSRVYRLRDGELELLTQDHTLATPGMEHVLVRAVGLENGVRADCSEHPLEPHDRFLLCSDGLHAALRHREIQAIMAERQAPATAAAILTQRAYDQGSQDNITALVLDVVALPPASRQNLKDAIESLPLLEMPQPGATVDGFHLQRIIADGRYSRLYLAEDGERRVVVKFPHPRVTSETEYHDAFLREAWIGARIRSPWVAETIALPAGRQTSLYSVMPYYEGLTLEQRLQRKPRIDLESGVEWALKLCKAVHALHRQRVIHRDIKPDNVLLLETGGLKLLDLGIARLPAWDEDTDVPIPGTASYMAPEQFAGERGTVASDIYALGVTLYRLFSGGAYPYGEIEPFSHPRFGQPKSLLAHRPDLPAWLDGILARAFAVKPQERHADSIELAFELEHGLAKGGQTRQRKQSLYDQNPLLFWKLLSMGWFLAFLFSLMWHALSGPR